VRVRVKILSGRAREQVVDVPDGSTYEELLGSLHINPEVVIVFRSGTPIPLDERVAADDIDILRVVTGGNR